MHKADIFTIPEVASNLEVSELLVNKFINKGLIHPVEQGKARKLTGYNYRQLVRVIDLYEKSYPYESIDAIINH